MTSVKDKLIKSGITTEQADILIKNFYIKEKDVADSFAEYYIKRIDEKQDKLSDKVDNLPTKIKNDIKEELQHYATKADIAQNRNKLIAIMTGIIAVALTIFGLIK